MRKLTIKKSFLPNEIEFIETTFNVKIPAMVQHYLTEYGSFGLEENCFMNASGTIFSIHTFIDYNAMYNRMKMFQEEKLGKKIPFALDNGGWTLVVSLDSKTKVKSCCFKQVSNGKIVPMLLKKSAIRLKNLSMV